MEKLLRKLQKKLNMENSFIDLIIRIKNGYMSRKDTIISPFSNFKLAIVKKLKELKYIKDYKIIEDKFKTISIDLKYDGKVPAITDVKIFSKGGKRVYVSFKELKPVVNNFGFSILSTPKGILTNKEARNQKTGGELLFNIW